MATSSQCFREGSGEVTNSGDRPTGPTRGGVRPCCYNDDVYVSHNICSARAAVKGGSGYYTTGCTDPSYENEFCDRRCGAHLANHDIIYNATDGLWRCCGGDGAGTAYCDRGTLTEYTLQAPAPDLLGEDKDISSSSSSTQSATQSSTQSSTSSIILTTGLPVTSASATPQSSSGLAAGAIAGIVVGAVVIALLSALATFFIMRRRKTRQAWHRNQGDGSNHVGTAVSNGAYQRNNENYAKSSPGHNEASAPVPQEKDGRAFHEMDNSAPQQPLIHEM